MKKNETVTSCHQLKLTAAESHPFRVRYTPQKQQICIKSADLFVYVKFYL